MKRPQEHDFCDRCHRWVPVSHLSPVYNGEDYELACKACREDYDYPISKTGWVSLILVGALMTLAVGKVLWHIAKG